MATAPPSAKGSERAGGEHRLRPVFVYGDAMSHRVIALYHDRAKALLAQGDILSAGVSADQVRLAEGLSEREGRLEIRVQDRDQALDVEAFLVQDGADSVEVLLGTDDILERDTIPHVPAA